MYCNLLSKLKLFLLKYIFCFRRFRQERVTFSSSVVDRASSAHLYLFTRFSRRNTGDGEGGSTLQCEVCTGAGSRYFCRRATGWGVCTMFIGYSLQATLEQINRKGLLQGRIEDVRVYSGQGMRRTYTLPPRRPHRSVRGYFLISLPFFSRTRCYYRRGCPSTIRTQPRYGIRSFLDSELAKFRGARCIQP